MENTNNQTMPETIAALNRAIAYLRTCAVNTTDILTGDIVNAVTEELDIIAANLEREQIGKAYPKNEKMQEVWQALHEEMINLETQKHREKTEIYRQLLEKGMQRISAEIMRLDPTDIWEIDYYTPRSVHNKLNQIKEDMQAENYTFPECEKYVFAAIDRMQKLIDETWPNEHFVLVSE